MLPSPIFEVIFAHCDEMTLCALTVPKNSRAGVAKKQYKKAQCRALARVILQHLLAKYSLDQALLDNMRRSESGRPYLLNPQVDFNISHSGDWVAVIFSMSEHKKAVGVDIEQPQKKRRYADLLDYYAKPAEIAQINDLTLLPELDSLEARFYLSWCLREAVLKSQGVGIVKLSEVSIDLAQQRIYSPYCPKGSLCFYPQLPFYLAYFFEHSEPVVSFPTLSQWRAGQCVPLSRLTPIIYKVNYYESDSSIFTH